MVKCIIYNWNSGHNCLQKYIIIMHCNRACLATVASTTPTCYITIYGNFCLLHVVHVVYMCLRTHNTITVAVYQLRRSAVIICDITSAQTYNTSMARCITIQLKAKSLVTLTITRPTTCCTECIALPVYEIHPVLQEDVVRALSHYQLVQLSNKYQYIDLGDKYQTLFRWFICD